MNYRQFVLVQAFRPQRPLGRALAHTTKLLLINSSSCNVPSFPPKLVILLLLFQWSLSGEKIIIIISGTHQRTPRRRNVPNYFNLNTFLLPKNVWNRSKWFICCVNWSSSCPEELLWDTTLLEMMKTPPTEEIPHHLSILKVHPFQTVSSHWNNSIWQLQCSGQQGYSRGTTGFLTRGWQVPWKALL